MIDDDPNITISNLNLTRYFYHERDNLSCFWTCYDTRELAELARAPFEPGVLDPDTRFFIGLLLAICSSVFIGASFIIKKKSLIRLSAKASEQNRFNEVELDLDSSQGHGRKKVLRAGEGGMGYLSDWVWWMGLLSMAIGEAANFAAYAFVPASLVTPLGALSVVVTAVMASYFLGERLNIIGKMACVLCLLGSTMTILHAPKDGEVTSLSELGRLLSEPAFIAYLLVVIVAAVVLIFFVVPKWGNSNVFVYVLVCSLVGSLSVMSVKAVGIAIVETARPEGPNDFRSGLTYIFLAALIVCVAVQMIYLNKALDVFNTSVVSPIYYVFFTAFVMVASGILYEEFGNLSAVDDVGLAVGFAVIVIAVFMLHLFKDFEITMSDVSYVFRPQPKPSTKIAKTARQARLMAESRSSCKSSYSEMTPLLLPKTVPVQQTSKDDTVVVGDVVIENAVQVKKKDVETARLVEVDEINLGKKGEEEVDGGWMMNRDAMRKRVEQAYLEEKRKFDKNNDEADFDGREIGIAFALANHEERKLKERAKKEKEKSVKKEVVERQTAQRIDSDSDKEMIVRESDLIPEKTPKNDVKKSKKGVENEGLEKDETDGGWIGERGTGLALAKAKHDKIKREKDAKEKVKEEKKKTSEVKEEVKEAKDEADRASFGMESAVNVRKSKDKEKVKDVVSKKDDKKEKKEQDEADRASFGMEAAMNIRKSKEKKKAKADDALKKDDKEKEVKDKTKTDAKAGDDDQADAGMPQFIGQEIGKALVESIMAKEGIRKDAPKPSPREIKDAAAKKVESSTSIESAVEAKEEDIPDENSSAKMKSDSENGDGQQNKDEMKKETVDPNVAASKDGLKTLSADDVDGLREAREKVLQEIRNAGRAMGYLASAGQHPTTKSDEKRKDEDAERDAAAEKDVKEESRVAE